MPNRWQAITWTNADPVYWCIYAALEGDVLEWHHMDVLAYEITRNWTDCPTAYSSQGNTKAPQFWYIVRGIHHWIFHTHHKRQVIWKSFPCHDITLGSENSDHHYLYVCEMVQLFYSLWTHWTGLIFIKVVVCGLPGSKIPPELSMIYCQLNPSNTI